MLRFCGRIFAVCTIAFFVSVPMITYGALVPCDGVDCSTCHIVTTVNGVVKWLVQIMVVLAGLILAWAGFTMVTSGGSSEKISHAKEMMVNALIGFIILLSAWLVVDTILKALVGETLPGYGPWNEIQCSGSPAAQGLQSNAPAVQDGGGGSVAFGKGSCTVAQSGACSPDALAAFGGQSTQASQICGKESGGNPASLSNTDRMRNVPGQPSFSVGLFQINLTVHELVGCGPGGSTLNCKSAFRGTNYTATIENRPLYDQCVAAAQNPQCNISNAVRIQQRRGSWKDWSTAAPCGL